MCGCQVAVGARTPLRTVRRIRYSVESHGPGQVSSLPTGDPDKVRLEKNSRTRYTWWINGLQRGSGFSRRDILLRMAVYHEYMYFFCFD